MTELTFLLDLLLNHKLPMATKVAVTERIKEVEARLTVGNMGPIGVARTNAPVTLPSHLANQAPSTIAALARHPDLMAALEAPTPVATIAQTPAAQAAIAHRQEMINQAVSGKPEKGRTSPRKF